MDLGKLRGVGFFVLTDLPLDPSRSLTDSDWGCLEQTGSGQVLRDYWSRDSVEIIKEKLWTVPYSDPGQYAPDTENAGLYCAEQWTETLGPQSKAYGLL